MDTNTAGNYSSALVRSLPSYAPITLLEIAPFVTIANDFLNTVTIAYDQVAMVISNGNSFTQASDPQNPLNGEYVWNPYIRQIRVYGATGRSIQIFGSKSAVPLIPPFIPPPFPEILVKLPCSGNIELNRSFEQMPSASFNFEVDLSKSTIEGIFAPGLELDFYGLPLRINSLSISELPHSIYSIERCRVQVSLGGRWENKLEDAIFLRDSAFTLIGSNEPFQDPDCATGKDLRQKSQKHTTVNLLLDKVGIPYVGPILKPVDIPPDAPKDATVDLSALLQERSLVAQGFLFWSNPQGVEIRRVGSQQVWTYNESQILGEIKTQLEAIDKQHKRLLLSLADLNPQAPNLVNFPTEIASPQVPTLKSELPKALGFQYPNSELNGRFSEIKRENTERSQGQKPRYIRQDEKIETEIRGDKNSHLVPDGIINIQSMSLISDIGGMTRNRTYVTSRNGADWIVINEIWGFAATAAQVYDNSRKRLNGNPAVYWQKLESTTAEYIYDESSTIGAGTGYLLQIVENGYRTVRYKQENAQNPETLGLRALIADSPQTGQRKAEARKLYEFFQIPVIKRTSYVLKLIPGYSSENAYEIYKKCNRDGTSSPEVIYNPNFAPPYYIYKERTESSAYASRSNPDSPPTINVTLPDLEVGEELKIEAITTITPAQYKQTLTGFENGYPQYTRGEQISPQKWVKWTTKYSALGQSIGQSLTDTNEETGTGDPPLGTRRSDVYVREEELQSNQKPEVPNSDTYRYYLQTAGYTKSSPPQGAESFPLADTIDEALNAASCKLAIENWRNGHKESLEISANFNIAEGDRFNYFCNGEFRQRVVLSASTSIEILGVVDGTRRIKGITSLSLGLWRQPELTYSKVLQPKEPKPPQFNTIALLVVDDELGQVLPWEIIRSRRNP